MTWTRELDEATILATKSGHYHVILFYLLCGLAAIPTSFLVFSQVFTNATPPHWCAPPPELETLDLPEDLIRNLTVPEIPGQPGVYQSCSEYAIDPRPLYAGLHDYVDERSEMLREGGSLRLIKIHQLTPAKGEKEKQEQIAKVKEVILNLQNEVRSCTHGWRYNKDQYQRTLVTEFNLVCDKDWEPRICNTLFWVGSIFGNLFFGWMSDRYGRRPTILLMISVEVPLAIASSFPVNYWTYTALRVVLGLFFPALYQLPFILALELMPPARRPYAGIAVGMLFATGMCLLALLAYALTDWFYFSLATTLPFIFLYGFFIWCLPESPRWLVGRGRIAEAEKVLRHMAKKNHIDLPHGFLLELHKKIKEEDVEIRMIPNVNGHVTGYEPEKDEYIDRRLSNMLTFKPELSRIEENMSDSIEKKIATEEADITNRKSKLKSFEIKDDLSIPDGNEEICLNTDIHQKSTQTDPCRSPANTLRRKSVQLVTRIFIKDEENHLKNKIMDDQNSEGDCHASPLDIFRYPNLRKKFFILTFDWVALGVVYNSLTYNMPNLGVNDYLAFFIGGAVEIPSYFFACYYMEKYGRRWVLCLLMSIGGIACLCCLLVPDSWPWITVTLVMLSKLCTAGSFSVFYVMIGEILPTVIRAQAMGAASFICGLGLLACPYIVYLAVYSRALPLTIMGILSFVGGVTTLFLPETLNQPLPQTLNDGEAFGKNIKIFSCVHSRTDN